MSDDLFNIVRPQVAYFGQKDFQQAQIIKRMVENLDFGLKVKILPIIREKDGLALSSRNTYLSALQRKEAVVLYKSLKLAKQLVKEGNRNTLTIKKRLRKLINSQKATRIDYLEIVDPKTLRPVKRIRKAALLALAVFVGKTRLIDNALIKQ